MRDARPGATLAVPFQEHRLHNGLRVIVAPEHTSPVVTIAVVYHVGMRLEPRGRTGFAHLFEHLMFQGSSHLKKMEFVRLVERSGGLLNGTTRSDFTTYFEVLPRAALELGLWAEADRMRGPVISQAELDNQRLVVHNEIRMNVLNRPYGGFPWLDLHAHAFSNWHNAHNGYGEMTDLEAASLGDALQFFTEYYTPANAALVIVGDVGADRGLALAERYFADIPGPPAPPRPSLNEVALRGGQCVSRPDPHASLPALALAYHTPPRGTPAFAAMGVLDQFLLQGDDALLQQELVRERGIATGLQGGINPIGTMYEAETPLLWYAWLVHDRATPAEAIFEAFDRVVERVQAGRLDPVAVTRAKRKALADYYRLLGEERYPGIGRASLLAWFSFLDDRPERITEIPGELSAVGEGELVAVAREYLTPQRRTAVALTPGAPT